MEERETSAAEAGVEWGLGVVGASRAVRHHGRRALAPSRHHPRRRQGGAHDDLALRVVVRKVGQRRVVQCDGDRPCMLVSVASMVATRLSVAPGPLQERAVGAVGKASFEPIGLNSHEMCWPSLHWAQPLQPPRRLEWPQS